MADQQHTHSSFRLPNGLNCSFTQAPTWKIDLFSEIPFIPGDYGRFQAAANHLIEHTVMVPSLFERGCTRLNIVKFSLNPPSTVTEVRKTLNHLGKIMANPVLNHLDSERERIFEEWAGAHIRTPEDLENWGSFTQPVTPDNLDPKDPSMTYDKAIQLLNRQADWTKAFTEEELTGQMKFLLSAKHLTLRVSGPLNPPTLFYRMLKQSAMADIPKQHPGAIQIAYREVPADTDYKNIRTSTVTLPLVVPPEKQEIYKKAMRSAIYMLREDKDIALYWVRYNKTDKTENWSLTITQPKEKLLKSALWGYMMTQITSPKKDLDMCRAFEDIMVQSKEALRRDNSPAQFKQRLQNGGRI